MVRLLEKLPAGVGPTSPTSRTSRTTSIATIGVGVLLVSGTAAAVALGFLHWDPIVSGFLTIVALLCMLLVRVPIGAAMGIAGVLGVYSVQGMRGLESMLESLPHDQAASWSLSVIPMFVLMGMLLWRSGVTSRMYETAGQWLGWLPGGLAVTTNVAGAGLSAASGSTIGVTYALGRVAVPAMIAANYPTRLTLASVMMVGSSAQLIPPSLLLVVYSGLANTVVGDQLVAGILPGVLIAVVNTVVLVVWAAAAQKRSGVSFDRVQTTWRGRWMSLGQVWPVAVLIAVVVGGLYLGWFTATEAGAVGAFMSLVYLFVYQRGEAPRALKQACIDTVSTVGAIFILVIGAAVFSRAMALTGVTRAIAEWVADAGFGTMSFAFLLIVVFMVLGLFLEPMSMMLLTVPVLLPVLGALDVDLIWFGVFIVLMGEIANVTPPVGILLYVVHRLTRDREVNLGREITLKDVITGAMAFVWTGITLAVLLILFPGIVGVSG
ncbi:TRAP transporter large permease [Pseudonocardia hispaniensis]|uniref:TRAP transporter large permease n=1 Tax=Pseudonocardia hispaniensis TaxID=904933 RepID=A0ABW1IXE5_9PSEU